MRRLLWAIAIASLSATFAHAQTSYRYVRVTTLDCAGEKYQEIDWFDNGTAYPNPHLTSATSNGMSVWGDNADWEITQIYDGNTSTHAWLGTIAPPYTHEVYLDLGATTRITPDSIRITKPDYTTLRHFQCWASTDAVSWDLFLDTTLTSTTFAVRTFRLALVADTQRPTAPLDLTASAITATTLSLSWKAATDNRGVHEYRVFRNGTQIATTANTSYPVAGLTASTAYQFHVVAADRATNLSPSSDTVRLTTPAPDNTAPAVPTALSATLVTARTASLGWTAPAGALDVAGYVVYLNGVAVGCAENPAFALCGLKPSTTYRVIVRARDMSGNMSDSSAPAQLTTTAATSTRMTLGTNFWNIAWGGDGNDPFTATHRAVAGDNPWKVDFRNEIEPYVTLRFMDFGEVNNTAQSTWMDRTVKSDLIQAPMAFEWMIDLCNRVNRNMWVCIPHPVVSRDTLQKGSNDYMRKLAVLIKHGVDMRDIDIRQPRFAQLAQMTRRELIAAGGVPTCEPLKPNLQLYIEYSNETWNFGFTQAS